MLTPPSSHRQALLKQPSERERDRACASERREGKLAAQLRQERARALSAKREQIASASRERDMYLANVRSLFKMSPPPKVSAATATDRAPGKSSLAAAADVSKRVAVWSEVSTAAPSTAGGMEDDDDDAFSRSPPPRTRPAAVSTRAGTAGIQLASTRANNAQAADANLLNSLDLHVGDQLRKSLEAWLDEADEDRSGLADSFEGIACAPSAHFCGAAAAPERRGAASACSSRSPSPEVKIQVPGVRPGSPTHSAAAQIWPSALAPSSIPIPRFVPRHRPAAGSAVPTTDMGPIGTSSSSSSSAKHRAVSAGPMPKHDVAPRALEAIRPTPAVQTGVRPAVSTSAVRAAPAAQQDAAPMVAADSVAGSGASSATRVTTTGAPPPFAAKGSREVRRSSSASGTAQNGRAMAPSLKVINQEEKALEQSLMRLDFGEMRRQFSGKEPLWKKEALDKSFEANSFLGATRHEEKIKASLERLDTALDSVRAQVADRETQEAAAQAAAQAAATEAAAGAARARCPSRERSAPPSRAGSTDCVSARVPGNRKARSRSGGSGYGQRLSAPPLRPVTTLSAPAAGTAPTPPGCRIEAACGIGSAQGPRRAKAHAPYGRPPRA